MLRVPSAVVEHEWNMLMNPLHPDMAQVEMAHVDAYTLDTASYVPPDTKRCRRSPQLPAGAGVARAVSQACWVARSCVQGRITAAARASR